MHRRLPWAAALALAAAGLVASACDVTPPAASANGSAISAADLNTQLSTFETTNAGGCLLELENPQLTTQASQGAGGSGTYTMAFTDAVLKNQVGDLLVGQYAASRGVSISQDDLTKAASDFEATLDGEASSAVQQSAASGTLSLCQTTDGGAVTGAQLLAGLPGAIRDEQVRNEAFDEKLLAMGADLSDAAVAEFYAANQAQFTADCVSDIATDTQAHAQQLVAQLDAGVSFAAVAKASSLDSQSAAAGGALGCDFTQTQVEQALQLQNVPTGQPLTPMQDQSTGRWVIYEVTSQSVQPLSAATAVIRQELLRTTDNLNRVNREVVGFAHRSDISVDPRYGTWKGLTIVPPHGPPDRYLLSAAPTATLPTGSLPSGSSGSGSVPSPAGAGSSNGG
ncbi:MAG: peptidylprolyl isomerase [Acidimicrobiales bacterium]